MSTNYDRFIPLHCRRFITLSGESVSIAYPPARAMVSTLRHRSKVGDYGAGASSQLETALSVLESSELST